ncbi:MAG: DUF3445 domain-containing protein [Pseudomonadota bacterium]
MQFQPFSSPARPFIIGLAPLDSDAFLLLDKHRLEFRAQKQALYGAHYEHVCRARADTLSGQIEAARLITQCLATQHAAGFTVTDQAITDRDSGTTVKRPERSATPLADAALLVQDDLLLMRRQEDGWRLVAASLCFPSSWNLHEKFDKPLEAIHGPVPMEEKMHLRIRRIFDAMRVGVPLWRENWGITSDGDLRHDRRENQRIPARENVHGDLHLRVEYQTLHKLPGGSTDTEGDILFTVGVRTRAMRDLARSQTGQKTLQTLLDHYRAMPASQRDYKGLGQDPDALIGRLEDYVKSAASA